MCAGGLALAGACSDGTHQRSGSASSDSSAAEPVTTVYLRLRNGSQVGFDDILVRVGEPIEFGALAPGASSEYLPADGIYSYAYVEATRGDARYIFQPIDYTGEVPLQPGYYTYVLSVALDPDGQATGWLNLRMLTDRPPG